MLYLSNKKLFFEPDKYNLLGCKIYAQSPQAIELENVIRIYFSSRAIDDNGKYLSKIAFVDVDKSFDKIQSTCQNEIIPLGKLGTFDEHGIFPISPLKVNNEIWAYTCGWSRRVSVSVETSTGLAISNNNGLTFEKYGDGPIFSNSLNEPFLVGDSFVRIFNNKFHMWYIFGTKWKKFESEPTEDRVYKIGYAVSDDGINWNRDGKNIIPDELNPDECQALPSVVFFENKYHMVFCFRYANGFRNNKRRGYRLGYAYSEDGINWTRDDNNFVVHSSYGDWDFDMACYPHLTIVNNKLFLLYNGNEFGKGGFGIAEINFDHNVNFKINTANASQLLEHLKKCNESFYPKLSEKVNIEEYTNKIKENAITFESWNEDELIGNISIYANDSNFKKAYITNVSVLPEYYGKGIAHQLLQIAILKIYRKGFLLIELEVHEENSSAIKLYEKFNFQQIDKKGQQIKMQLTL